MKIFAAIAFIFALTVGHAVPTYFDLVGIEGSLLDGETAGSVTKDGIVASFVPLVGGIQGGRLWQNAGDFGVNATGSGDVTDWLDSPEGVEAVSVSFNRTINFTQLVLSDFYGGANDTATLNIGAFPSETLLPLSSSIDVFNFSENNQVNVGEAITVTWASGNGFSFDGFAVTTVPESGTTLTFLGLTAFGLILFRRFQK